MSQNLSAHIRKEAITNGISNAIFNGLAAWALLKDKQWMSMWGEGGIAIDIAATAAILLFIVALILIPLNRSKHRKGKAPAMHWDNSKALHRFWQRFPRGLVARAFCFAGLGLLVVAPVTYLLYIVLGIDGMSGPTYAIVKGLWAGVMAAIMCIPMIQIGLSDPLPAQETAQ
jgi:hypothetical protein